MVPYSIGRDEKRDSSYSFFSPTKEDYETARRSVDAGLLWSEENVEVDDYLHEPNPEVDRILDRQFKIAWSNLFDSVALAAVVIVLVGLFAGTLIFRRDLCQSYSDPLTLG